MMHARAHAHTNTPHTCTRTHTITTTHKHTHTQCIQFQSESTSLAGPSRLSPLDQAKNKLTDVATHHRLQRPIKLYCQPFVSQAELKECVLGQKSRTVRLKKLDQQYSTLVLPRLQLRPIAMLDLEGQSCVSECETILELLSVSED